MTQSVINSFAGRFHALSNFSTAQVLFEDDLYPTVEHAFQAAKVANRARLPHGINRQDIAAAPNPTLAKRLGRKVAMRPDWEQVKLGVMLALLRQKFSHGRNKEVLLSTGDALLVEGNTWGDRFWGQCLDDVDGTLQWQGQNVLGRMLMQVRTELTAYTNIEIAGVDTPVVLP